MLFAILFLQRNKHLACHCVTSLRIPDSQILSCEVLLVPDLYLFVRRIRTHETPEQIGKMLVAVVAVYRHKLCVEA